MDAATPVNKNAGTATTGRTVGGRYTLGATVGSGGMGTVWRAHDELLRRDVAVKEVLLPPGLPARERELLCERTLREARAAAALNHPAVVRVYDVVQDENRPWIVMELLEARSISEVLRDDGPMPVRKVAEMGLAVLGALEAAHRVGVLHRDVKPGNVLLGRDGRTTLTDFGVARSANESPLTSTGLLLGSPQYIAPERARGQQFGPSSDLWSLGATLYTAVEGRAPFDRGDPLPTMTAVVCEPPDPTSFAGALEPILDGLLAKSPDERWDAARTRSALKTVLAGGSVAPSPTSEPAPKQQRRLPDARSLTSRLGASRGNRALENTGAMQDTGEMESTGAMEGTAAMPPVRPPAPPRRSPAPQPAPPPPISAPPAGAGPTQVRPVGREYGRPLAAPDETSVLHGNGPAPTAVYRPVSGAPVSAQPVSPGTPRRAQYLNSPEAMRASAAGETSPVPNPGTIVNVQQRRYALFAGIALLVVLVMGTGAYVIGTALSDSDKPPATSNSTPKPAAAIQLTTHTDADGRFTVDVPQGWTKVKGGTYVDYLPPSNSGVRLRLLVENASSAEAAVNTAERIQERLQNEGTTSNFQTIRKEVTDAQLGGQETWEWEWSFVNKDGQARHVLWRTAVVDGRSFHVYLASPETSFDTYRDTYSAVAKTFQFTSG